MTTKIRFINIFIFLLFICGCAWIGKQADKDAKFANEYYDKGLAYEQNGDLTKAFEQYKLALTITPDDRRIIEKRNQTESRLRAAAERRYKTGIKFYNQGRIPQARRQFLLALKAWPEHSKSLKMLIPRKEEEKQIKYIIHTIKPGESISKLAKMYYGDYREFPTIAKFNNFSDATQVRIGQKVKIPEITGLPFLVQEHEIKIAGKPSADESSSFQAPDEDVLSGEYMEHIIKPGESISKLAKMYYGDYRKFHIIAKFNNLSDSAQVETGQMVNIPEIIDVPFLIKKEKPIEETAKKPDAVIPPEKIKEEKKETVKEEKEVEETAYKTIQNYRYLGIELFNQKKYQEAITELNKVINASPDDKIVIDYLYQSYYQNGIIFFKKKKYLLAKKGFEKAFVYNKKCPNCLDYINRCKKRYLETHYNKGLTFFANEQLDKAIEEWNLVLGVDPNYKQVKKNIKKARILSLRLEEIKKSRE